MSTIQTRQREALDRLHVVATTSPGESSVSVQACDLQVMLDHIAEGLEEADRRLQLIEQREQENFELRLALEQASQPSEPSESTTPNEPPAPAPEPASPEGDEPAAGS